LLKTLTNVQCYLNAYFYLSTDVPVERLGNKRKHNSVDGGSKNRSLTRHEETTAHRRDSKKNTRRQQEEEDNLSQEHFY